MTRPIPRLSRTEAVVLNLLAGDTERYGLALVAAARGRLKRGTVYVTLGRMEEKGLVVSRQERPRGTPGLPRRLYRPTALGRRVYEAHQVFQRMLVSVGTT
jgi:PadR family transcriptional regulator